MSSASSSGCSDGPSSAISEGVVEGERLLAGKGGRPDSSSLSETVMIVMRRSFLDFACVLVDLGVVMACELVVWELSLPWSTRKGESQRR